MPAPHTTGNKPEKGRKRVQRYNYSTKRQNFSGKIFRKNPFLRLFKLYTLFNICAYAFILCSIHKQPIAHFQLVVCIKTVLFIQAFEADSVLLGDGVHAFADFHNMERVFESLVGTFLFLF